MRVVQISRAEAIKLITDNDLDYQEDVLYVPLKLKGEVKSLFDLSVRELNSADEHLGVFLYTNSKLNGIGKGKNVIENGLESAWEKFK